MTRVVHVQLEKIWTTIHETVSRVYLKCYKFAISNHETLQELSSTGSKFIKFHSSSSHPCTKKKDMKRNPCIKLGPLETCCFFYKTCGMSDNFYRILSRPRGQMAPIRFPLPRHRSRGESL
ncbi:hypothetical protein CEXT_300901 [Caerostris extrusa]|uniref:Uncharacterized protein n=1 Tax=Caerostris extrusa TaxID=172846 RepID=A0AAV4MQM2_CAEEX|nr:hypothetical protein CEXT_300901 [Caerostris extrusa]